MSNLKSFLKVKKEDQNSDSSQDDGNNDIVKEKPTSNQLNLKDDESDSNKNNEDKSEEESESFDEERASLAQIIRFVERKKKKLQEKENKNENKKENKISFLNKKRNLKYEPIKYDANKGEIQNSFCPSKEELNEFFNNCEIRRHKEEDEFSNNSNYQIFNVEEWLKANNITDTKISTEQMFLYSSNIKIKEEPEIFSKFNEPKIKATKKFDSPEIENNYNILQTIIYSNVLSFEQKEFIKELLETMSKIDIKDIEIEKNKKGKNNKLELVLDLDNTCVFSIIYSNEKKNLTKWMDKYSNKKPILLDFKLGNKIMHNVMLIRKGIDEFVKYVEPLCNFYISTLGMEEYGKAIKNLLTQELGITFLRFKGKEDKVGMKKKQSYLKIKKENTVNKDVEEKKISDLKIKKENTVIIDDSANVWNQDSENVIISRYFYDEEAGLEYHEKKEGEKKQYEIYKKSDKDKFISLYKRIYYCQIQDDNWKSQKIINQPTTFYQYLKDKHDNYNQRFNAEYLYSEKCQFIYLKNVLKQIYLLKFVYDFEIPLAIKMIRISTLANMVFYPIMYTEGKQKILEDIIISCGGVIYNNKENVGHPGCCNEV